MMLGGVGFSYRVSKSPDSIVSFLPAKRFKSKRATPKIKRGYRVDGGWKGASPPEPLHDLSRHI